MPIIVILLPCKSVTMNLLCYAISFAVYCIIVCGTYMASSIVNFGWQFYHAITEYCCALGY